MVGPFLCASLFKQAGGGPPEGTQIESADSQLVEFIPGCLWLWEYPVHYAGLDFFARMSVLRLSDDSLLLHSPCEIDAGLRAQIMALGVVRHIVAPGNFHYLHVPSAQSAFPDAETYICPGIERKAPGLHFDWVLGDRAPAAWVGEMDQVLVRGNRIIWEVAFFHRASRTLLLVDLIENIGDSTRGVGWGIKLWWKLVFRMWNRAKPAPEYQMGWKDKVAAKESLERILDWDFERIVLAHGDLIASNGRAVARDAWARVLGFKT